MASVPAAPIRQPRGPSTAGFNRPASPVESANPLANASGPPVADTESTLRRNRTLGSGQSGRYGHGASASLGGAAFGYAGAAAGRAAEAGNSSGQDGQPKYKESRFRSGSLSSTHSAASAEGQGGLVRRTSTRDRPESRSGVQEVVHEDQDLESPVGGLEGGWGKGLARQSSLPSRRVHNASMSSIPPVPTITAPPRPPRRISDQTTSQAAKNASLSPSHSHTHSLGSIAGLTRMADSMPPPALPAGAAAQAAAAGVSRTQSLRNQARNATSNLYGLGRSSSLRQAGEHSHHRATQSIATPGSATSHTLDLASPITNPASPNHPFTPPSPPPQSSTAALPPFQMPLGAAYGGQGANGAGNGQAYGAGGNTGGADVKRHQSLGHHYGRLRDRLDRAPALLSLDQRGNAAGGSRIERPSSGADGAEDAPPTSPLYNSVWSPQTTPGDDGWHRSIQGVSEAMAGMNVGGPGGYAGATSGAQLQQQMGMQGQRIVTNGSEEPAWVANLLGGKEGSPAGIPRAPSAPPGGYNNGTGYMQQQHTGQQSFQSRWPDGQGYIPLEYLQQQQQQQLLSLASAGYGGLSQLQAHMQAQAGQGGYKGGMPMQFNQQQGSPYLGPPGSAQGYQMPLHMPMMPMPPITPNSAGFGYQHSPQVHGHAHTPAPMSAPAHHFGPQDQAVIELARAKGLNPATFNCQPPVARFFVIKSYTEEDVQKSLKHEIWSSTVLGNRRLNNAFKESADKGPIYLFFSVNGSRHFCGVAEMLTEVDESQDSKVWTQDKWKGIFKVKWIFVRDVPSAALRHIRLIHTPEQKPITNSRDTQELHYEAGCEVLQIFLDYQNKSKTSLLQDFAYYETLSEARSQNATPAGTPHPGSGPGSSNPSNGDATSPAQLIAQQGMLPNQPVPVMPMAMPMLQMPIPMQFPGQGMMGPGQGQGYQGQQGGQGQGRMPSPHGQQNQQGGRGPGMQAPPVPPIPARFR